MRAFVAALTAVALGCATAGPVSTARPIQERPIDDAADGGFDYFRLNRHADLVILVPEAPAKSKVIDLPPGLFYPDATMDELKRRHAEALEAQRRAQLKTYAAVLFGGVLGGALGAAFVFKPWETK